MPNMDMSRRSFLLNGSGLVAAGAMARVHPQAPVAPQSADVSDGAVTAAQVIDRLKANVGVPWMTETVDKIIAGAPDTPVRGVATTMMATLAVLQRAAAAGRNLIITHEPTFFSHLDTTDDIRDDDVYKFKSAFIQQHNLVVFRFHDHWHRRTPDGIATGMARELRWERYRAPSKPREFEIPECTLAELARDVSAHAGIKTLRVIGDQSLKVTRVLANWGYASLPNGMAALARPDIDVVIIGEAREWEVIEYAQDQIASGKKKGLLVLGHVVSEQAGMKYCAEWMKSFITDLPIDFVAADEPFWRP
jgi:putative NIF3 family GTP cyclohydrolase 1 type 2